MLEEHPVRISTEKVCKMCAPSRRKEGLEPNYLVRLNPTVQRNLEILVCPDCDGIS